MAKKFLDLCPVLRRKLVRYGKLVPGTGRMIEDGQEWVTEPCGTPLFGKNREHGKCSSCAKGYSHEENYPVEEGGNQ
jgi:hypothetical protein